MRGTATWLATLSVCVLVLAAGVIAADETKHDHSKLPPGPIRERHELMETQGEPAENITTALNGAAEGMDTGVIQRDGQAIAQSAHRIPSLFPKGSTDPNSRALPVIWEKWDQFEQFAKQLEHDAQSLSNAAGQGEAEELQEKAKKMFANCKSCHDQFRKPKEKTK